MKAYTFLLFLLLPILSSAQKHCRHQVTLFGGTPVALECVEEFSSLQVSPNDRVAFKVTGNVLVDQYVVVPDGASASARVLEVSKTTYNRPEFIQLEIISVTSADGQQIPVYSSHLFAAAEHVGITAWLRAGKKATAYVLEDMKIRILK